MQPSHIILLTLVVALTGYALVTGGPPRLLEAGRETGNLLRTVWLPLLLGFTLAGLITVLMPSDLIAQHLGADSGLVGLLLATLLGALTPGGPFIQFPVVAALFNSGAAPGPIAAYLTAWSLIPLQRTLVWEIPFLGVQFAVARLLIGLLMPLLVGLSVPPLLRLLGR